jgi:hypothetical protein
MKVEEYQERKVEVAGWPVNLTSYRVGDVFHCKADNVSVQLVKRPRRTRWIVPSNCWLARAFDQSE